MTILYYSAHPFLSENDPAGYATHMKGIIGGFESHGHKVVKVICGNTASVKESSGAFDPVHTSPLKKIIRALIPKYIWQSLKDLRLLEKDKKHAQRLELAIALHQPSLIYERVNYLQDSGIRMAQKHKIRYFCEINAPYVEEKKMLEGSSFFMAWAKKKEHYILEQSDHIFVVSSALKNAFQRQRKNQNQNIHIVPNGVFESELTKAPSVLRKDKPTTIGFVGSILKWHGIDVLLKAFALVQKKHNHVRLLIVGSGEDMKHYMDLSTSLHLQNVTFTGSVSKSKAQDYIDQMDICTMINTNWYGSPMKIFEYGARKKAMLLIKASPILDVIEPNKDALILQKADPEECAEKLSQLITQSDFREKIGIHFYNKIKKSYTWETHAATILSKFRA